MFLKRLPAAAILLLSLVILSFAQAGVPAFHPAPPQKGENLPPLLPGDKRWGTSFEYKFQTVAYQIADRIPNVLYQLPCYCYCDRIGHKSLRSCYETTHAANCAHCLREAYFAFFEIKKGKTPKQIRDEIIHGDWQNVNMEEAADKAEKMF